MTGSSAHPRILQETMGNCSMVWYHLKNIFWKSTYTFVLKDVNTAMKDKAAV